MSNIEFRISKGRKNFKIEHSLFNLPAHASWRLRFNQLQVMLQEQIGSISKIGLWQAGIHHSYV